MKEIPIVYATNDEFAKLCSVSISSIIENSNKKYKYIIYIFHSRLSKKNIDKLKSLSNNNVIIKVINVSKYIPYSVLYEVVNYTYEIYYRLYATKILNYNKIIYLDCDTILLDDIGKLYKENIKTSIGIIRDYSSYLRKKDYSFNSGVMLLNKELFEKNKVRDKCIELIKQNKYELPDQDALNEVCKNDKTFLNPKYNYQMHMAYNNVFKRKVLRNKKYSDLFKEKPIIIHYSYLTKPYYSIFSEYNNYFWKYAKKTPYYNELVDIYLTNSYSVIRKSPVEEIYLDMIYEGKYGLKKILYILKYELIYYINYKRGKKK